MGLSASGQPWMGNTLMLLIQTTTSALWHHHKTDLSMVDVAWVYPLAALCSLLLFAAVVRSCSKHGCSHFPVTVFISCFWQAFFAILLPWPVTMASNWGQVLSILGFEWFALILMGLLPAQMLRQGVIKGRPIRILVWVFAIVSQATPCVLFGLLGERNQFYPEIFFPCLAFTLATVVSLVLVSTELAFKRDEFLKNRADDRKEARWRLWRNYVYSTTAEPEAIVIEEVGWGWGEEVSRRQRQTTMMRRTSVVPSVGRTQAAKRITTTATTSAI